MTSILERIAEQKRQEVLQAKQSRPLASLPQPSFPIRDFVAALKPTQNAAVIAEIKKASPSKGVLRADFDVASIATNYEQHGARCLSVLTDRDFFQGHPENLKRAKSHCNLPILRKDFIIDAYQIHESLSLGADCILLIVALLDDVQLMDFCQLAHDLGMSVLVESHTQAELERALQLPTPLVGINNRSLHTFKTDIQLSIDLRPLVPADKLIISESGINTRDDILRMQAHGINTFLIGEHLMREKDEGHALTKLLFD